MRTVNMREAKAQLFRLVARATGPEANGRLHGVSADALPAPRNPPSAIRERFAACRDTAVRRAVAARPVVGVEHVLDIEPGDQELALGPRILERVAGPDIETRPFRQAAAGPGRVDYSAPV